MPEAVEMTLIYPFLDEYLSQKNTFYFCSIDYCLITLFYWILQLTPAARSHWILLLSPYQTILARQFLNSGEWIL
jgi:hypothetical protein